MTWTAKEVVRDLDQRPHLFIRLDVTGAYFPERALEPFVRVGRVRSRLVRIDPDGLGVRAYFDQPLPDAGAVEFGYGEQVVHRVPQPFDPTVIARLDRTRLPQTIEIPDAL